MIKGNVFNIQRFCLHDGPGIRTVVFLKGCLMRCVWCHNPESYNTDPEIIYNADKCKFCNYCACVNRKFSDSNIIINRENCKACGRCEEVCLFDANEISGYETNDIDVINIVARDEYFYEASGGGMTLSGGEPAYQEEFSLSLIQRAKKSSIQSAIETSGFGRWEFFKEVHQLGGLFLFDIKLIDSGKHEKYTGKDNKIILQNLNRLFNESADIIIRLPIIPGINDDQSDIENICTFLKDHSDRYRYAEIMSYHNYASGKRRNLGIPGFPLNISMDDDYKLKLVRLFSELGCDVRFSG